MSSLPLCGFRPSGPPGPSPFVRGVHFLVVLWFRPFRLVLRASTLPLPPSPSPVPPLSRAVRRSLPCSFSARYPALAVRFLCFLRAPGLGSRLPVSSPPRCFLELGLSVPPGLALGLLSCSPPVLPPGLVPVLSFSLRPFELVSFFSVVLSSRFFLFWVSLLSFSACRAPPTVRLSPQSPLPLPSRFRSRFFPFPLGFWSSPSPSRVFLYRAPSRPSGPGLPRRGVLSAFFLGLPPFCLLFVSHSLARRSLSLFSSSRLGSIVPPFGCSPPTLFVCLLSRVFPSPLLAFLCPRAAVPLQLLGPSRPQPAPWLPIHVARLTLSPPAFPLFLRLFRVGVSCSAGCRPWFPCAVAGVSSSGSYALRFSPPLWVHRRRAWSPGGAGWPSLLAPFSAAALVLPSSCPRRHRSCPTLVPCCCVRPPFPLLVCSVSSSAWVLPGPSLLVPLLLSRVLSCPLPVPCSPGCAPVPSFRAVSPSFVLGVRLSGSFWSPFCWPARLPPLPRVVSAFSPSRPLSWVHPRPPLASRVLPRASLLVVPRTIRFRLAVFPPPVLSRRPLLPSPRLVPVFVYFRSLGGRSVPLAPPSPSLPPGTRAFSPSPSLPPSSRYFRWSPVPLPGRCSLVVRARGPVPAFCGRAAPAFRARLYVVLPRLCFRLSRFRSLLWPACASFCQHSGFLLPGGSRSCLPASRSAPAPLCLSFSPLSLVPLFSCLFLARFFSSWPPLPSLGSPAFLSPPFGPPRLAYPGLFPLPCLLSLAPSRPSSLLLSVRVGPFSCLLSFRLVLPLFVFPPLVCPLPLPLRLSPLLSGLFFRPLPPCSFLLSSSLGFPASGVVRFPPLAGILGFLPAFLLRAPLAFSPDCALRLWASPPYAPASGPLSSLFLPARLFALPCLSPAPAWHPVLRLAGRGSSAVGAPAGPPSPSPPPRVRFCVYAGADSSLPASCCRWCRAPVCSRAPVLLCRCPS